MVESSEVKDTRDDHWRVETSCANDQTLWIPGMVDAIDGDIQLC